MLNGDQYFKMGNCKFLLLILLSVLSCEEARSNCDKDLDCENGFYCLNSFCESCIPCKEVMNRHPRLSPSGELLCARKEEECGNCLLGYVEDDWVDGRRSSICYPLAEKLSSNPRDPQTSILFGVIPVVGILFIAVLIYHYGYNFARFKRSSRPSGDGIENLEEIKVINPEIRQPSAPPIELYDQENLPLLENRVLPQLENQHLNQAVPIGNYHRPEDVSEPTDQLEQLLSNDENSESSFDSSETIPSHWTPFPQTNYERSISLEAPTSLVRSIPVNELTRSASYPDLSHAHIKLSNYRSISHSGEVTVENHIFEDQQSRSRQRSDGDSTETQIGFSITAKRL